MPSVISNRVNSLRLGGHQMINSWDFHPKKVVETPTTAFFISTYEFSKWTIVDIFRYTNHKN